MKGMRNDNGSCPRGTPEVLGRVVAYLRASGVPALGPPVVMKLSLKVEAVI